MQAVEAVEQTVRLELNEECRVLKHIESNNMERRVTETNWRKSKRINILYISL